MICFDTMTASRWRGGRGVGGSSQSSTDRDGAPAITGERVELNMGLDWTIGSLYEVG